MKKVAVIGAGIGGLALAIRLQSAGVDTTIVEARDKPGGRAYYWERDGFTFDAGPTVITAPDSLRELWRISGHDISEDVNLLPISPFYRLSWPDGVTFDYSGDDAQPAIAASSNIPQACTAKAMRSSAMSRFSISDRWSAPRRR
jgi:phytoene desaturase